MPSTSLNQFNDDSERTRLAFVVDPKLKQDAERIAQSEDRTLSNWLRKEISHIVANHLNSQK